jgi:hypothetical protein
MNSNVRTAPKVFPQFAKRFRSRLLVRTSFRSLASSLSDHAVIRHPPLSRLEAFLTSEPALADFTRRFFSPTVANDLAEPG